MIGNFPDHEFEESYDDNPNDPNAVCLQAFKFDHDDGSWMMAQCGHTREEHPGDGT